MHEDLKRANSGLKAANTKLSQMQTTKAITAAETNSHVESAQANVSAATNRLKMIKRKMYGRANLDLLRIRVLAHR